MKKTLQQHLEESNMTYQQHLGHSVRQSNRLIVLAVKSYIHGLLPWFFVNDGPLGVYRIYKEIRHMHHVQKLYNREDHDQS